MTREQAEILGLQALSHIVAQDDLFAAFLAASGASPAELRARAADPAFLGAVLDFLLEDDRRVLDFAAAAGIAPTQPAEARARLPGGQVWHWT